MLYEVITGINDHVLQFPVLLMENVLRLLGTFTATLKLLLAGKYVPTKCLIYEGY